MHASCFFALLILTSAPAAVGNAGPERLLLDSPEPLGGMSWEAYGRAVEPYREFEDLVPLRAPLRGVEGDVVYGINAVLPVGDVETVRNLSWALVLRGGRPPSLVVDRDADGDLSDEVPLELERRVPGGFAADERLPVRDGSGRRLGWLRLRWEARGAGAGARLFVHARRERRGSIRVEGRRIRFVLRTSDVTYDAPDAELSLDLDGDGRIAFAESDVETFSVGDGTVVLDGRRYLLSVERFGRRVTLRPTGIAAPRRPTLQVGTTAPELPGEVRLADRRGGPLLLEFWTPYCSGSEGMAATLVEARNALAGVRFVSVTDVEDEEASAFNALHGRDWAQVSGERGSEAFVLYRVRTVPTYYVLDAGGVIVARGHAEDWPRLRGLLAQLSADAGR